MTNGEAIVITVGTGVIVGSVVEFVSDTVRVHPQAITIIAMKNTERREEDLMAPVVCTELLPQKGSDPVPDGAGGSRAGWRETKSLSPGPRAKERASFYRERPINPHDIEGSTGSPFSSSRF